MIGEKLRTTRHVSIIYNSDILKLLVRELTPGFPARKRPHPPSAPRCWAGCQVRVVGTLWMVSTWLVREGSLASTSLSTEDRSLRPVNKASIHLKQEEPGCPLALDSQSHLTLHRMSLSECSPGNNNSSSRVALLKDQRRPPRPPPSPFTASSEVGGEISQGSSLPHCFCSENTLVLSQIEEEKLTHYQRILGSDALSVKQVAKPKGRWPHKIKVIQITSGHFCQCVPWYVLIKN